MPPAMATSPVASKLSSALRVIGGRDDLFVANPEIASFVAAIGGIDDTRVCDPRQHERALARSRQAPMRSSACATLGVALRAEAVTATRTPASDE